LRPRLRGPLRRHHPGRARRACRRGPHPHDPGRPAGTFTHAPPSAPPLARLERLLACKLDLPHVDPTGLTVLTSAGGANVRYPAGRRAVARTILGHGSTSYPTRPGSP